MSTSSSSAAPPFSVQAEYRQHNSRLEQALTFLDGIKPNSVEESVEINNIRNEILSHQAELLSEDAIVNATLSDVNRVSDTTTHLLQLTSSIISRVSAQREEANGVNGESIHG